MNPKFLKLLPSILASSIPEDDPHATEFSKLSQEAQDLIVRAATGEFESGPPKDIPESVRAELIAWATAPDPEPQEGGGPTEED